MYSLECQYALDGKYLKDLDIFIDRKMNDAEAKPYQTFRFKDSKVTALSFDLELGKRVFQATVAVDAASNNVKLIIKGTDYENLDIASIGAPLF